MNGTDIDPGLEERFAELVKDLSPKMDPLMQQLRPLVMRRDNTQHKYMRLLALTREAMKLLDPYIPCERGCGHCCNMAVAVTEYEATRIAAFIGKAHMPVKKDMSRFDGKSLEEAEKMIADEQHEIGMKYLRVPCVFLGKEKECTIYQVRPMACRVYHTIAPTSEPCQLGMAGERAKEVPQVNLMDFIQAHVLIEPQDASYADIREWFPEGRGNG